MSSQVKYKNTYTVSDLKVNCRFWFKVFNIFEHTESDDTPNIASVSISF